MPARILRKSSRNGFLRRLRQSSSGIAVTEFAMTFPILLAIGLTGLELVNHTIVTMQINQLAVQIADNASRIGDESMLQDRRIYESDIQDLFYGAEVQAGDPLDLYGRGRIILSSLEVVDGTSNQYIRWQRCMGERAVSSSYGNTGDGLSGGFPGMGPPGEEVIAFPDEAVMFVELVYEYRPLVGNPFGAPADIRTTASFTVRDDRDLSQIYQKDATDPAVVAVCGTYGATSYSAPSSSSSNSGGASTSSTTTGGSTSASSSTSGGTTTASETTTTTTGGSTTTGGGTTTSTTSGGSTTSSGGTYCSLFMLMMGMC